MLRANHITTLKWGENVRMVAILKNNDHPEYGEVSMPLPIKTSEYGHCMELLSSLGIGDALNKDCKVEELTRAYPTLRCLEGCKVNIDELDYLAKRLDGFDAVEVSQFQTMADKLKLTDMKDLINLTFSCQQATVIADFSDLESVGRAHYMNTHDGCASAEELDNLDGEETAILLIEDNEGTITRYGVRKDKRTRSSRQNYDFSLMIICGNCGSYFRRKVCRDVSYWVCRKHNRNKHDCNIEQVQESKLKEAFLRLYYNLKCHRVLIFNEILTYLQTVRSRRMLWSLDIVELNKRISELSSQNQMLAALKQQGLIDPDIFISQSNELTEQLRAAKLDKERLLAADSDDTIERTQELLDILEAGPDFLDHFDGELFGELIDKIIVDSNERVRFRLKNGLELTETIERTAR